MLRRLIVLVACAVGFTAVAPTADAAYFKYRKRDTTIDGRIQGVCGSYCWTSEYRAGSGNGGKTGCQWGNWIPNGTYNVQFHSDSYNHTIKGRVWYLNNYYCANGVTRTELFVHTEEYYDRSQLCWSPYNEDYCWDGAGDYYSLGCIKVARRPVVDGYSDVGRIDSFHHSYPVNQVIVSTW